MLDSLTSSTYSSNTLGLTDAEKDTVLGVYMDGLRYSFIFYTVCTGLAFILSVGIGNTPLDKEKNVTKKDEENQLPSPEQALASTDSEGNEVVGEKGNITGEKAGMAGVRE
jgi:hypothetical protein